MRRSSKANSIKTLKIDGKDVAAREHETILELAKENDIFIPTLCHMEGLSEYGGCRLCMVEIKGSNKLQPACMTTAMVYHAAARGITIESVESRLEGDLDLRGFLGLEENVRPGYENIRVTFKVKADATAEQLEELFKFSPVHNSVCQPVNVEAKVEMVKS